jgi:hypothetical protein
VALSGTYATTAALEAANTTDLSAILAEAGKAGTFTIRDYSSFTAQVTADTGKVNYIRSTSDATKVWVRATILSNGSAGVGFIAAQAGAVNRTLQDKNRDTVLVKDFGAIIDGVTDTTAASNLATGAADTYGPSLRRAIHLSDGTTVLGAGNVPLFVRKGQTLTGAGVGSSWIDVSGRTANTNPIIKLGEKSDGTDDSGGDSVCVRDFSTLGGPDSAANIDTNGCAGWTITDVFFSSPGIGIKASGGDGFVTNCTFDDGLNGLVISGANILTSNNIFYLTNQQVSLIDGAHDIQLNGNQHEYFEIYGLLLDGDNMKNIRVNGGSFLQNEQFASSHAVFMSCNSGEFAFNGISFRNLRGAGIKYGTGIGNVMSVHSCIFDGTKTLSGYTQSTTMQGIDASNVTSVIHGCVFRNLPGQPITLGGAEATTWVIDSCQFSGNTGGSAEINVTSSNANSRVIIRNCLGSGRPLVNVQSTVPVIYENNDSRVGYAAISPGGTLTPPYGARVMTMTGGTDLTSIVAQEGDYQRLITIVFGQARTVKHGVGNIRLSGSADFSATYEDTLTLANNFGAGGTWYEVSRTII